jgi:hypothetical protein
MPTEDAREGLNAFLEKRKPVWKNQQRAKAFCSDGSLRRFVVEGEGPCFLRRTVSTLWQPDL